MGEGALLLSRTHVRRRTDLCDRYVVQSVSMFNPVETFVRNSNYSVISVQMQYRLGPFGSFDRLTK